MVIMSGTFQCMMNGHAGILVFQHHLLFSISVPVGTMDSTSMSTSTNPVAHPQKIWPTMLALKAPKLPCWLILKQTPKKRNNVEPAPVELQTNALSILELAIQGASRAYPLWYSDVL